MTRDSRRGRLPRPARRRLGSADMTARIPGVPPSAVAPAARRARPGGSRRPRRRRPPGGAPGRAPRRRERSLRLHRRQPLVLQLDRHLHHAREGFRERVRMPGARAVLARSDSGRPTTISVAPAPGRTRRSRAARPAADRRARCRRAPRAADRRPRSRPRSGRRRDRARGRAPARRAHGRDVRRRGAARARAGIPPSASTDGGRVPATGHREDVLAAGAAADRRRPPPGGAPAPSRPRATASAVEAATSCAFPSDPPPRTTAAGPPWSRSRTFWASSRSPLASSPATSETTSASPSTSTAPSTSDAMTRVPVPLLELPQLAPQPLVLLDHLPRVLHRRSRIGATDRVHEVVEERSLGVDLAEGVGTDQRLDAPHPGADRAFVQEPDHADVPRPRHVRPAAELARVVAELHDADRVAVLLSEEHHGARAACLLHRGLEDARLVVPRQAAVRDRAPPPAS